LSVVYKLTYEISEVKSFLCSRFYLVSAVKNDIMKLIGLKPEVSEAEYLKRPFSILALKGKDFGRESINLCLN